MYKYGRVCLCKSPYVYTDGRKDGVAVAMRCGAPRRAPASLATADGRTDGRTNRRRDGELDIRMVYVPISMHMCVSVSMYMYIYVYVCICACMYVHVCICMYMYVYVCMYVLV